MAAAKATLLISFVLAFLSLLPTIFMLQLYDRVVPTRNGYTLAALCLIALFLVVIWTMLEDVRISILRRVAFALDEKLSIRVLTTLNRYPDSLPEPQASLVPQDLANLREFLGGYLIVQICDFIFAPVMILAAFALHPLLGLAVLLVTLLSAGLSLFSQRATRMETLRSVSAMNRAGEFGRTVTSNAEPIRVLGMLSRMIGRWRSATVDGLGWTQYGMDRAHPYTLPLRLLRHLYPMLLQVVAVVLYLNEMVGAGVIFAGAMLAGRAIGPVDAIANGWRMIWNVKLSAERIEAVLAKAEHAPARVSLPRPDGPLVVSRVAVAPRGRDVPTLQDVSFSAAPGSVIGVVGPSGAGKSTLAKALVGAWPVARGSITLDGHEISHWDQEQLGAYIGYVPQDIDLLPGTLAENISRFEAVTEENSPRLIEAVKITGLLDIISKLPDGLSTRMGAPDGRVLSGGQRQRVALARALYGDPRLVVLDEPNSNIDASGEQLLANAIARLREQGAIVLLITHRMNMLSYCDQVLVLNNGTVHAFGARDQVLDRIGNGPGTRQITDARSPGERNASAAS